MGNIEEQVELINNLKVLATEVEIPNPKAIRSTMDDFKSKLQDTIIVLVGQVDGKVSVIATVPKSLTNQVKSWRSYQKHDTNYWWKRWRSS